MQNLFPDYSDAKAIPRTCCAYFTQPGNLIFAKRFWFWFGSNQIVGQSLQRHCKWRVHRQFGTKERKHRNNTWSQYKFQWIWVRVGHSDAVHSETFGLCAFRVPIWAEYIKYVKRCAYLDYDIFESSNAYIFFSRPKSGREKKKQCVYALYVSVSVSVRKVTSVNYSFADCSALDMLKSKVIHSLTEWVTRYWSVLDS